MRYWAIQKVPCFHAATGPCVAFFRAFEVAAHAKESQKTNEQHAARREDVRNRYDDHRLNG